VPGIKTKGLFRAMRWYFSKERKNVRILSNNKGTVPPRKFPELRARDIVKLVLEYESMPKDKKDPGEIEKREGEK